MPQDSKKPEAVRALIRIVVLEGVVLALVVASYFMTGSIAMLLAGLAASMLLFGPMFLRWVKDHGTAMKAKPNSIEESQG